MEAVPVATRGAKGVCDTLRGGTGEMVEGKQNDDYVCRTTAEGGMITVTAISSSFSSLGLEEIVLEGAYASVLEGAAVKGRMITTAKALFSKLQMDRPPGLELAIQNRSQSVVAAGRMAVTVDHRCAAAMDCRISVRLKAGGRSRRGGRQG